jgi:Transposase domain (DUF772)
MAYIEGDGRNQGTLFPMVLDLIAPDHMCRVIDALVEQLDMEKLGFERAQPAETGRPGYDPRALLKLCLYGYLNQIRPSRRLEAECIRKVELMWLLGRLYPDHRSIAEFRRMHREAFTVHLLQSSNEAAGVCFCRYCDQPERCDHRVHVRGRLLLRRTFVGHTLALVCGALFDADGTAPIHEQHRV